MSQGSGPTLGERSAEAGIREAAARHTAAPAADPAPARETVPAAHPHVWVLDEAGVSRPAVVVEQARGQSGWLVHVVMVLAESDGLVLTQQGWVAADRVRRA